MTPSKGSKNSTNGPRRHTAIDLGQVVQFLRRRWPLIALGLIVGWGLGAAYMYFASVKYESSAQILVMRKDSKLATQGDASSQSESAVNEDLLATHMQIIQSREIVGEALKKGKLDQLPSILSKLSTAETPTTFVIDRMTVTRGGTGQSRLAHVLNVSFRHTSETETKEILEAIVASYKTFLGAKFQDVSQQAALLIGQAKNEILEDLRAAEEKHRIYMEQAPLLWKGEESANIHRNRYEELNTAVSEARLRAANAKARLDVVEQAVANHELNDAADFERLAILDHNDFQRLGMLIDIDKGDANTAEFQSLQPQRLEMARAQHESLLSMIMQRDSLSTDLGPDHPKMIQLSKQIEAGQSFLKSSSDKLGPVESKPRLTAKVIVQAYRELLKQDVLTAERQEEALLKSAKAEEKSAKELVEYELRAKTLQKEVDRQQALLDAVLERLREINLVKDYGGFVTEVIAPIEIGERVSPKLLIAVLAGTFVGLVFGGAMAGAAELRDRSFHSIDALKAAIELPVLSIVPQMSPKLLDEETRVLVEQSGRSFCLATYFRPRSREAEVFRGLRTSLLFNSRDGRSQVISCSSSTMGDGKSTVLANLAVSIAQSARRVLLVDCDLRRPMVHKLFNLEDSPGMADVAGGLIDPPDAIQSTDIENLDILPAGTIPENPAELLSSPLFEQFLAYARERYDFVLLDCPPVLAVSDPCVVAPKTDSTLLVVRLNNNSRPQVLRSVEMLQEVGATTAGIIVNGVATSGTAGENYGYGYDYAYGGGRNSRYYEQQDENAPQTRRRPRDRSRAKAAVEQANGRSSGLGDTNGSHY